MYAPLHGGFTNHKRKSSPPPGCLTSPEAGTVALPRSWNGCASCLSWICDGGISHDACIPSQNRTSVMGGRIVAWSPFLVLLVVQFTPAWTVVAGYHRRFQQTWKKTLSTCSFRLLALPLTWHWGNLVPYQCIMPGNNTPLDFGLSPVSVYRWVGGGKFDWVSIHNTNLPNRCVNK
jgi:hypothetical protein